MESCFRQTLENRNGYIWYVGSSLASDSTYKDLYRAFFRSLVPMLSYGSFFVIHISAIKHTMLNPSAHRSRYAVWVNFKAGFVLEAEIFFAKDNFSLMNFFACARAFLRKFFGMHIAFHFIKHLVELDPVFTEQFPKE